MCEIVSFDLAKKLKEKGFKMPTKNIIAMYDEYGVLYPLTTSADYVKCTDGTRYKGYYDYEDFDGYDYIAPIISQVLKWLREEKKIHICINIDYQQIWYWDIYEISFNALFLGSNEESYQSYEEVDIDDTKRGYQSYEQAALAAIEYTLDNLI